MGWFGAGGDCGCGCGFACDCTTCSDGTQRAVTGIAYTWASFPNQLVLWTDPADAALLYKFTVTGYSFLNNTFTLTRDNDCVWGYSGTSKFTLTYTWESYSKSGTCPDTLQDSGSGSTPNCNLVFGDPSGFPTSVIHKASALAPLTAGFVTFLNMGPTFTSSGNNCGTSTLSWTNDPPMSGGSPCSGFSAGTTYTGTATNTEDACGCCDGVWTPTGGTATFSNRFGTGASNCYDTHEEAFTSGECAKIAQPDKAFTLEAIQGLAGCGLTFDETEDGEYLADSGSEATDAASGAIGGCPDQLNFRVICSSPDQTFLKVNYGGAATVLVNYETSVVTLVIREDTPSGYTDFLLQYTPASSICNTSLSLTVSDFTVIEYTKSAASAPETMRADTLALGLDITVTGA